MSRLIPPVLGATDLPLAVLSAARLDGLLWAVHDGYCPIDEPDTPMLRALSLAPILQQGDIIVGRTAAWVHGAGTDISGASEISSRTRPLGSRRSGVRYREISVEDDDIVTFGPDIPAVTSRSRSIGDIAVDTDRRPHDSDIVIDLCGGDLAMLQATARDLAAASRRPHKAAGLEFLGAVATEIERRALAA